MPRHARLEVAGNPQLVLQRSPHDLPMFHRIEDYRRYLADLRASSLRYRCAVHAYALLPQEVCLLVTGPKPGAVGRMMQSLGRRYAHYANIRDGIRGARWQGRYRSCPVGGSTYVLRASAHVELSSVRAGFVSDPAMYRWSSYAANALGVSDPLLTPHSVYLPLVTRSRVCRSRYRKLMAAGSSDDAEIRMHVEQGRAWGSAEFLRKVAARYGGCAAARQRGRPRKHALARTSIGDDSVPISLDKLLQPQTESAPGDVGGASLRGRGAEYRQERRRVHIPATD